MSALSACFSSVAEEEFTPCRAGLYASTSSRATFLGASITEALAESPEATSRTGAATMDKSFFFRYDLCIRGTDRCNVFLRRLRRMVAGNHLRRCQDGVGVLAYLDSVTIAQVNRSDSTLLPREHYCSSVIAPEVVVRRKTRGGFAP